MEYNDKRKKNYDDRIDFGYNSLHLLVKYNEARLNMIEYSDYRHIVFEIQIRTIAMDCWASLEHELVYKETKDANIQIHRRLKNCADMMAKTDMEMQKIYLELNQTRNN